MGYSNGSILMPSPPPLSPKKYSFFPFLSLIKNYMTSAYGIAKYSSINLRQLVYLFNALGPSESRFKIRLIVARLLYSFTTEYSYSSTTFACFGLVLSISSIICWRGRIAAIFAGSLSAPCSTYVTNCT